MDHWLGGLGQHCAEVRTYPFGNLPLTECQLEELWTFVQKQAGQLTPRDRVLDVHGDTWGWIAFAPLSKRMPAWVAGKRPLQASKMRIDRLNSSTDGHLPFFPSDELPPYAAAWLAVAGQPCVPPRTGKRGPGHAPPARGRPTTCGTRSCANAANADEGLK